MPRLFFALQPAPAQSVTLAAAVAPLVSELGGQAVPASSLHATLCFIGSVAEEQCARLREVAARVRGRSVTLGFDALDFWEKPEILVATAGESAPARDLSVAIGAAVLAAGFTPDIKPFRAHLTLARKIKRRVAKEHEWPRVLERVELRCEEFVLMESRRDAGGSIYSVVESWPLYADASR
jgi:RNA 2',3'-cyclic 3'-phosphodiesterase